MPQHLSKHGDFFTISCLDLPGFGDRAVADSPTSIEANIPDLVEQLATIEQTFTQKPQRRILVGYSLGGMIAHAWAQFDPSAFQDVVLVNSSFASLSPIWRRMHPMTAVKFALSAAMPMSIRERMILRIVANKSQERSAVLPQWIDIAKEQPFTVRNVVRQLVAAASYRPIQLSLKPSVRVHVAASKGDRLCHDLCSAAIAKALAAPITYHDHGGHDLAIDDPEWLARFIADKILETR